MANTLPKAMETTRPLQQQQDPSLQPETAAETLANATIAAW